MKQVLAFLLLMGLLPFKFVANASELASVKSNILVMRSVSDDSWLVSYSFSSPVKKIYFSDNSKAFRKNNFQVVDPGVALVHIGTRDVREVVDAGSTGVTSVSIIHKTITDGFGAGHEFHSRFSTGDVLVQTGFYDIYKVEDTNGKEIGIDQIQYTFKISGPGHILLKDKRYDQEAIWATSNSERQAFVFFGMLEPQLNADAGYAAVLDPQLPKWVSSKFNEHEPVLYKYFADKLFKLTFTPIVYFSALQPNTDDDSDTSGQVLAGARAVKMSINKDDFAIENDFLNFKLHSALLAHENVHLWNAHSVKMTQSWLWEGGAEILAQTALSNLGFVSTAMYQWYRKEAGLNQCLGHLKNFYAANPDQPLNFKYQDGGAFPYRCGYMIGYLTNIALKQANGSDIFDLWSALFKHSLDTNIPVSKETYLWEAEKIVKDPLVRKALHGWLMMGLDTDNASGGQFKAAMTKLGETWQN